MSDKAAETGSRHRAVWSEGDLGTRSRVEIQRTQEREVEEGRSGRFCDQVIKYQKKRGIIGSKSSSVAQYKGEEWGGGGTQRVTWKKP